jgi:hypothetical protein
MNISNVWGGKCIGVRSSRAASSTASCPVRSIVDHFLFSRLSSPWATDTHSQPLSKSENRLRRGVLRVVRLCGGCVSLQAYPIAVFAVTSDVLADAAYAILGKGESVGGCVSKSGVVCATACRGDWVSVRGNGVRWVSSFGWGRKGGGVDLVGSLGWGGGGLSECVSSSYSIVRVLA